MEDKIEDLEIAERVLGNYVKQLKEASIVSKAIELPPIRILIASLEYSSYVIRERIKFLKDGDYSE
jgi:hypothetical protein